MTRKLTPQKATKKALKGKVAITGPSGAGKTYSALQFATVLAEGGNIAVIDTENGSASLYADLFDFDVIEWTPPYSPTELAAALVELAPDYTVILIDSLTHFWNGVGGTLDIVDSGKNRNSFANWKDGTAVQDGLYFALRSVDCHVITTMRSKTAYETGTENNKVSVKKLGMAPIQRDGAEYEFDLVVDLTREHQGYISKSRATTLDTTVVAPNAVPDFAVKFLHWLNSGERAYTMKECGAKFMELVGVERPRAIELWAEVGAPKAGTLTDAQLTEFVKAAIDLQSAVLAAEVAVVETEPLGDWEIKDTDADAPTTDVPNLD